MQSFKYFLLNLHNFLKNIGINLKKTKKIFYIKKYIYDLLEFKKLGGKINFFLPILGEHKEDNTDFDKHYFYHETIVSSYIYKNKPNKHVDIGSRLSGFVANVASYREIEFFDLRPSQIEFENIKTKKINLLNISEKYFEYTDSLSCLYVIGHIGLGRYGDKINPEGSKDAFNNLVKILKTGGRLYIATPISNKTKIYFNAYRVYKADEIISWNSKLDLINFDYVDDNGNFYKNLSINDEKLNKANYGCGIYTFLKKN